MNNLNVVCQALNAGKRVELNYGGHTRKIEVHSVGVSKKGYNSMLVYQVEGGSNGQKQEGWKQLNLDGAASVTILDEASEAPRSGYRGGVRGMIEVIAHVPAPLPEEQEAEAEALTNAVSKAQANTSN
jgi:hypothetical protein